MTRSQGVCRRHWPGFGRRRLRFLQSLGSLVRHTICTRKRARKVKRPAQIGGRRRYRWRLCCGQVLEARAQRRHRLNRRFVLDLVVVGHGGLAVDGSMSPGVVDVGGGSRCGRIEYARRRLTMRRSRAWAKRTGWLQEVCASGDRSMERARNASQKGKTIEAEREQASVSCMDMSGGCWSDGRLQCRKLQLGSLLSRNS